MYEDDNAEVVGPTADVWWLNRPFFMTMTFANGAMYFSVSCMLVKLFVLFVLSLKKI